MYLFIIFILTVTVPLVVMPRYIKQGALSPYGTVFQGALNTWFLIAFVFMLSSFSGQGMFARMQPYISDMIEMTVKNPAFNEFPMLAELSTEEKTELLTKSYGEDVYKRQMQGGMADESKFNIFSKQSRQGAACRYC